MKYFIVLITIVLISALMGCSETNSSEPLTSQMDNSTELDLDALNKTLITKVQEEITPEIISGLIFMREEEKLARDIYIAMANKYNLRIFSNISQSEQKHMNAMKLLLDRYGIVDPVGTNPTGVFVDTTLQALYNTLLVEGSKSVTDAMLVGKLIEETDIKDLDERLAKLQSDSDIKFVYENLRRGSEHHLSAFLRNL
ncbi:MAG: ferritin [Chlorobiaceae bacterium]|nr:ferritin [Chlorobiaceae bacterium]